VDGVVGAIEHSEHGKAIHTFTQMVQDVPTFYGEVIAALGVV
jgi:hypothetical protein